MAERWSALERDLFIRMRDERKTPQEIAKILGKSDTAVRSWARENDFSFNISTPDEVAALRARWAKLIGPMKQKFREELAAAYYP